MKLRTLSWVLAGVAVFIAAYSLFAWWAASAEALGRRSAGLGLFFAFTSAYGLIACLWLAPASALLALGAWLSDRGSAPACLLAAVASALPFVVLQLI